MIASASLARRAGWHVVDATTLRTCLGSPNPVKFSEARFTDLMTVYTDKDAIPWYQEADWALEQGSKFGSFHFDQYLKQEHYND